MTIDGKHNAIERRPRDRKQRILAAAEHQFATMGFSQVSMAAIAADVGVGASAVYRHYRGKQDLFAAVLDRTLSDIEVAIADPQRTLAESINTVARIGISNRNFGVLWMRDLPSLPESDHKLLAGRMESITRRLGDRIHADHPSTDGQTCAQALLAMMLSPSRHTIDLGPDKAVGVITQLAARLLDAATTTTRQPVSVSYAPIGMAPQVPITKREAILAAATRLFDQRGYAAVGLNDIGAAAKITGPAIYHHFPSKIDILDAILVRGNESLWLSLSHALNAANSVDDALDRVIDSYAQFVYRNPSTLAVLTAEVVNLPESLREIYRLNQHNYIDEWVQLLGQCDPRISQAEGRFRVHAAIAVINELTRDVHSKGPSLLAQTTRLARALLTDPANSGT